MRMAPLSFISRYYFCVLKINTLSIFDLLFVLINMNFYYLFVINLFIVQKRTICVFLSIILLLQFSALFSAFVSLSRLLLNRSDNPIQGLFVTYGDHFLVQSYFHFELYANVWANRANLLRTVWSQRLLFSTINCPWPISS